MKKIITIAIALVFALTMATGAFASADINALITEIGEAFPGGASALAEFVEAEIRALAIDLDEDLDDSVADALTAAIVDKLPIDADGDLADKVAAAMSNDFVSFLAGMYVEEVIVETTTKAPVIEVETGDSSVIAIAAFAAVSVAAAAAFVCLKKKED